MFALVSLSFASVDEQANFDNVVAFDAQQSIPGVAPGESANFIGMNAAIPGFCLAECLRSQTALQAEVQAYSTTGGTVLVQCQGSCSASRRSLQQVPVIVLPGQLAVITITGFTLAQIQLLQNNIARGNIIGIPPTSVITTTAPNGAVVTLVPSPVDFVPANPASATSAAFCSTINVGGANALNTRLCCTTQQSCNSLQALGLAANVGVTCCPSSTNGQPCFLPVANNLNTNRNTFCGFAPVGTCGCIGGKHSKKGLLGLLGLLGLIPLLLCLLLLCMCCLRRKRRGQAMLFSQTAAPMPMPMPVPAHVHAPTHMHAGPEFHAHP